ncbi:MAG TPA: CHASE2 domain-containing protein [Leptolyngbyaceae cyanobacterium]
MADLRSRVVRLRARLVGAEGGLSSWAAPVQAIALASLAATGLIIGVRALGGLQGMELALFDQMVRLRSDEGPDQRLLVVGITETDIQSRQEWPISDRTVTQLLETINRYQPRAIGLDLFRDVPIEPGHSALLAQMQTNPRLIAVCKMSSPDNPGVSPPKGLAEAQVGFSDVVVDAGGTLRRSLLLAAPPAFNGTVPTQHVCNTPGTQLLSLGFQLALIYLQAQGISPSQNAQGDIQLGSTVLHRFQAETGGYRKTEASGYQIFLNYRSEDKPVPIVSLSEILNGTVGADQIRDRIVLIGYTTPQAKDDFYTPYSGGRRDSQKMPGVLVHAQSVSQLLSAVLDGRPLLWTWSVSGEILWIFAWGVAGAAFAWKVRRPAWFALGSLLLGSITYGISYGLFLLGGWIPLLPPLAALFLAAGGVVLVDRFNNSAYGQAMYRQVKTLLRLDIAVDEERVERQVSEITQTDYFSDLQQRARELRQRPKRLTTQQEETGADLQEVSETPAAEPLASPGPSADEEFGNYLSGLQQRAKRLKQPDEPPEEAP